MIGNGPYLDGRAAHRRGDRPGAQRRLVAATSTVRPGRTVSTRSPSGSPPTPTPPTTPSRPGEGDNANIPPARTGDAQETYGTTLGRGDPGLLPLRSSTCGTAPSVATRTSCCARPSPRPSTGRRSTRRSTTAAAPPPPGITPPGIPGYEEGLCDYCAYDPEAAQAAFDEWKAAGNSLTEPIPIQFNRDAGHEPVVQIMIDNLAAIGIEAVADAATPRPTSATGRRRLRLLPDGLVRRLPDVRQLHVRPVPQHALGGNNHGFHNPEFDALVDEAKPTVDPDAAAALFREAEDILLNQRHRRHPDQLVPGRLRLQRRTASPTSRRPTSV